MATNTYENLPINLFIRQLSDTKGSSILYDEFKEELLKTTDNGNKKYNIFIKEDDNLCMLYNNPHKSLENISEFESSIRSVILEKSTLKPLVTQYNKILYNNESLEFIKDKDWNKFVIQKCYEGTLIVVFNHNSKWYITTRRCLNAQDSTWIRDHSYYDMFVEAMENKFSFEDLNVDYCYHFILVHYKNKNIVSYNTLGREYKELYHVLTTEKYTLKEVPVVINDKVKYITEEKFTSLQELQNEIIKQNENDVKYQKVTLEGYVLRYYLGDVGSSPFVTLKLQTPIYESLMNLKPNNSNIYQCFLELYQQDKLHEFLPYFTRYGNDVVKRIHISMQNISKEMLDLYHMTRNKNNGEMYNKLSVQYKKCLYEIHGLYIKNRKNDFENGVDVKTNGNTKSINVFDVYHYLKTLPSNELRQLYYDRNQIISDVEMKFLNRNCINTTTQSTLMFKHLKNKH
ncbi:hypothetical protein QKU48_gp0525 [Fadolivirus algeromassiliense]|jgi:hypothetical protein|uniref:RNA ligase n=1 Tax=Fadolivirus FV1/VV64 TaxID=3070911 RepID=A0A7D3QUB2_9VIRU|nr:hypothetical protein QKU48_gp0525 [Fadolivirus algeromassiliense]QKF93983.1 hypothetical protein Fadolivirus_1_525 [Fadolivirus FV1/VV64]